MILGIDEAGRGPWAGPLVVGAVVLGGIELEGLTDSKKLSKKKRELLYEQICERAQAYATGWVKAHELDTVGMNEALRLATRRAVEQIHVPYHEIIIDGTINFLQDTSRAAYVQTLAKADALIPSVSAASIIAKVERDRYMTAQDGVYPGYGFASHAGYGVLKHRQAIEAHGVTPLHRLSFAPLQKYQPTTDQKISQDRLHDTESGSEAITTKKLGDTAEMIVAEYLKTQGHVILEQNWRTKFCEIDIVSFFDESIYFTEVKYRKHAAYGDGLAAITVKKQRQMRFAAELYMARLLAESQCFLAVASVSGDEFTLDEWLVVT